MRKTLAVLAAVVLCLAFAPAHARTGYPTYRYTGCDKHRALLGSVYVCTSMLATRQSDDLGFIIHSAQVYVDVPDGDDDCNSALLDDPAATTFHYQIRHETGGAWGNDLFYKETPNLNHGNGCFKQYEFGNQPGQVLRTDRIHIEGEYLYQVSLNGAHDATTYVEVNVWEAGFGTDYSCYSPDGVDKCYRTLVS